MKDKRITPKINTLDLYGVRRPSTCPNHFQCITIPIHYNLEETIVRWITNHLKSRYYVGQCIIIHSGTRELMEVLKIGFEDPKELSYFTLACPHLKY